jgi:uncharacterized protein YprB with RNaseH-like and TPR domain
MLLSYAINWVTKEQGKQHPPHIMDKELVLSYWMTSSVEEERQTFCSVLTVGLDHTTVLIVKMLEQSAILPAM